MILKYQKIIDEFTTHTLIEPDYKDGQPRITELCTIGNDTYVHIPDTIVLPEQPFNLDVTMEAVKLTGELKTEIKALSPHVQLINARVVEKIRAKHSIDDEFKMLRIKIKGDDVKSKSYMDHVDLCLAWGVSEKTKIGL
ncbi:MAG: hypothetical protein HOD92_16430 [Deltaproteobacteria bacterium]|jgi:hypothetical protein|nr:hypothetical protein [Deltaproteobacteria bacterium]